MPLTKWLEGGISEVELAVTTAFAKRGVEGEGGGAQKEQKHQLRIYHFSNV